MHGDRELVAREARDILDEGADILGLEGAVGIAGRHIPLGLGEGARRKRGETGRGGHSKHHIHGSLPVYTPAPDWARHFSPRGCQKADICEFRLSVMSMAPGACVMAKAGFAAAMTACGVTPQAQNTGISSSFTSTGSP